MYERRVDLLDAQFVADPYPTYKNLRRETPIFFHPDLALWFFCEYEDVQAILRDRRFGRALPEPVTPQNPTPFEGMHANSLMEMEPPGHTRLRGLVNKVFTPARVEGLRSKIQQVADDLIDSILPRGEMDLLKDFAEPLPVTVIAELLGIPKMDRWRLRPWSQNIVTMYELAPTGEAGARANQAVREFSNYLTGLADERRRQPGEDLFSALVRVRDAGEALNDAELIATAILLLNAGHEATVNAIANGMLALFRHPTAQEALRNHPAEIKPAVEEMLRYDTPLQLFKRWVREDLNYKGLTFEKGTQVALLYGSANRDPRRFEQPDEFVITRRDNPHLTFGAGTHYCLGAPLARLEMQVAVSSLLSRLPDLRLADEELEYRPTYVIRGLTSLPVCF